MSRQGKADIEYKSYTLMDIGASYKFNRDVSVYGGVYNVTNKKVNDNDHGRTLDGRRYWVGVNVDF
nr:TonB-dependent receptor [Ignatzschineria indica]